MKSHTIIIFHLLEIVVITTLNVYTSNISKFVWLLSICMTYYNLNKSIKNYFCILNGNISSKLLSRTVLNNRATHF